MKFGSWTYNGAQVDLRHLDQVPGSNIVAIGVDLKEFYPSVEWDILEIPAGRNEGKQLDIHFQNCLSNFLFHSDRILS